MIILNIRLKEINGFDNSIQKIKVIETFYNHEAKKYKKKSKTYKIVNRLIHSFDGVLLLGVSSTAITFSVTGIGLIVVTIASGIGAGVFIFSKLIGEYLKRKDNTILRNILLPEELYTTSKSYTQSV